MQIVNQCPICVGTNIIPYSMKYQSGFPHISRTKCIDCGIVFANPMATFDELLVFYSHYYDKGNFGMLEYKQRVSKKINGIRLMDINDLQIQKSQVLQYKKKGSFLDVGFGLGEELAIFHQLGFNVYGTEFDQDCLNFLNKIIPDAHLFFGDLISAHYPDASFDVINVFHVIEHLINPIDYIIELKRIMKPGGIMIIGTPDISSWAYRLFRLFNFALLSIPKIVDGLEHTVVFNKKTLRKLFKHYGFGILEHYSESLGESLTDIRSSNLTLGKKVARYLQTFVKINQVLILRKL